MQLNDIYKLDGLLNKHFPQYQVRDGQVKMSQVVTQAISEKKSAVIEGATGVGKGFAYLIPAILSDEPVIVSTSNKSLQDQLDKKDLPTLQAVFGKKLSWTVLKGKNNYFCWDHFQGNLEEIKNELCRNGMTYQEADLRVQEIGEWAEKESVGDIEYLPFELPFRVKEMITCDNHTVHEKDSDGANRCFAVQAKLRAKSAQIVLVNHTLLAIDISLRAATEGKAGILPKVTTVIIDEAHEFEKASILAFSDEISVNSLYHLLSWGLVKKVFPEEKQKRLIQDMQEALKRYLPEQRGEYYEQKETPVFEGFEPVINGISSVISSLQKIKNQDEKITEKITEITKEAIHLQERLGLLSKIDENVLRWAEARNNSRGEPVIKIKTVPIDISEMLRDGLFSSKTVICTSATLAVSNSFDFFRQQIGMPKDCLELIVPSPFDYKKQALVYVSDGSQDKEWEVSELVKMSKGRAFLLFTSYKDLRNAYEYLSIDYPKIMQGQNGMTRAQVLEQFKSTPNAVLFATKSFWEGVDVQGEQLSLVVIWKIPFENPYDLVFKAKCDKIDQKFGRKGVSFFKYAVPDACIKLKQGVGRLIRSTSDTGVIALMDSRINYKPYGSTVVEALPPAYRTQQLDKVRAFFDTINK
jgi:ATP-dependent DNA helicase DinG